MDDQDKEFAELAHRLAHALDAWEACVGGPTERGEPQRKVLVKALEDERKTPAWQSRKRIDAPLLAYWLKGRDQLQPHLKHNRLPSEEDCAAIARALKPYAPEEAQRLPRIGWQIADLARCLLAVGGPRWRKRVLASIDEHPAGPAEPADSAERSEAARSAEPTEPVEPTDNTGPSEVTPFAEPAHPAAPVQAAGAAESAGAMEQTAGRRRWATGTTWATAATVAGLAGTVALFIWLGGDGESSSAGKKPSASAGPSTRGADTAQPGPAAAGESGGIEGNHRCGKARSAGAVSWSPCTLVAEEGTMSFLVQLTNTSGEPVTVRAKLAFVQAAVEQTCPEPWGTSVRITVPAKATRTSSVKACTASPAPARAFQARGWVVPDDTVPWGYREHSPTLHVQNDGTPLWADQAG
ncbi:hypothetical protein [Streptomyces yaizuensis]|uniref:Uncharacterized protein n=1 Tax=Streptomyces yaizuensis TaxID=2989713 RepID=A0ABQ5P456_9ACTN|nr:hypothetical protein [Streptomyces sp. YSPA8]GLF97367.1 hypothetical protein SYYSPA8_23740 [Streptomyces sp. YSPA8]